MRQEDLHLIDTPVQFQTRISWPTSNRYLEWPNNHINKADFTHQTTKPLEVEVEVAIHLDNAFSHQPTPLINLAVLGYRYVITSYTRTKIMNLEEAAGLAVSAIR